MRLPRRRLLIVTRQDPRRIQSIRERAALEQAFRAFAFTYGGTSRSAYTEPEDLAAYDAMIAVGRVLGKVGC